MQGGIARALAGLALAVGGGVAGATLVGQEAEQPASPAIEAQLAAAEAEKVSQASARHALTVAQRARRIARAARRKADESLASATAMLEDVDKALADSAQALAASQQAEQDAANALQLATNTSNRVDSTQIVEATAPGRVTTTSTGDYEALSGGPQVTVQVPASGYIEVYASAIIGDENDGSVAADGAVGLYEDGQRVPLPDQEGTCSNASFDDALFALVAPVSNYQQLMGTPPVPIFGLGCGATGASGPMLLKRSPGTHTYELRYGQCGCASDPTAFSQRTLQVAPRL